VFAPLLATLAAGTCLATPVRTDANPLFSSGSRWVSAPPLMGQLWGGEVVDGRFALYVGGHNPGGWDEKVLWVVPQRHRGKAGPRLALTGRLGGVVRYRARFGGASSSQMPGLLFPSIVRLPYAGCWTVTLTTGRIKARVVVLAQDV
jgi:hypothetical protein